jgi:hypothetical protein
MDNLNINLDDMNEDDLRAMSEWLDRLRFYAETKADAMTARKAGDITVARYLEGKCERIYKQLPDWARW